MNLAEFFGLSSRRNGAPRGVEKTVSLCRSLLSERGEVSGSRLAGEALDAYRSLDAAGRAAFFDELLTGFSPDPDAVGRAGEAYREAPSPEHLAELQRVVEPRRQELFRRINVAPAGTAALVAIRGHLLDQLDENPLWAPIASDLGHLFTSWFNPGFLALRRIDWRSPANILEKLIRYEAVHEIQGWPDLRRRLEADRRCYAFFHPALPDEPIIFIEAALARGMSDRVQPLLDPNAPVMSPDSADCAVFYSITNCQEGLRGVPLGSFLIKQVVEDLGRELPRLRKFVTLSPIPGFRAWLQRRKPESFVARLDEPGWFRDKELCAALERELVPLCAHYLLHAKQGKEPLDPVARFHLRNGARLERINWLGNVSEAGMQGSAGLMANYVYRLADVEKNHEQYTHEYKIAASHEIESLAKRAAMARRAAQKLRKRTAKAS